MFKHLGRRNMAGIVAVMVAAIAGASAYAFTASNTVPAHAAGAGSAVVSGYVVSSPTNYTFSADGNSYEEVAKALFISPETVRTHVGNAVQKLGVRTRMQAVATALRQGLIS